MGKNKKKKESYYDADQSGRKFGKWNFIMLAVIIVIEAVLYNVVPHFKSIFTVHLFCHDRESVTEKMIKKRLM